MAYRPRVFEILGLTEPEERLYRYLVETPGAEPDAAGRALSLSEAAARELAAALEQKGLITRTSDPETYVPVPPERALDKPLRERTQQIEAAKRAAMQLTDRLRAASARSHPADVVELIEGAGAVKEAWYTLLQTLEHETLVFSKPPRLPAYGMPPAIDIPNTRSRTLYDRKVLEDEPERIQWMLRRAAEDGSEARLGGDLPTRMFIADRRAAVVLVTGAPDEIAGGLLVKESDLLMSLIELFELLWSQATPLELDHGTAVASGGDGIDATDRRVLALLMAGLTDKGIARALGVSQSTVERRVRSLMSRMKATSRFQLGAFAATQGHLSDVSPRPSVSSQSHGLGASG